MSKFWFDYTKDILPNHMISTDVKDMPEFFQTPEYEGKSMMCRKLNMLPLECISAVISQEAAGRATRKTVLYAASSFLKA